METCSLEYTAFCSQEGRQQIWGGFLNQGLDAPLSQDASDRQWWKQNSGVRSARWRYQGGGRGDSYGIEESTTNEKNNNNGKEEQKPGREVEEGETEQEI